MEKRPMTPAPHRGCCPAQTPIDDARFFVAARLKESRCFTGARGPFCKNLDEPHAPMIDAGRTHPLPRPNHPKGTLARVVGPGERVARQIQNLDEPHAPMKYASLDDGECPISERLGGAFRS